MGLNDIFKLFEKRNRLLLFLVLWLIVGITVIQFYKMLILGMTIFLPLLLFCFILFIGSIVFRSKKHPITEASKRNIKRYVIIGLFTVIVFLILGFGILAELFWRYIFLISIYSYVIIITIYWTVVCYDSGVKLEDKLAKSSSGATIIIRWGMFLGGIAISILLLNFLVRWAHNYLILTGTVIPLAEYNFLFITLPMVMLWIIVIFSILGLLLLLIGNLNSWLGIFFTVSVIYCGYLIFQAILRTDTTPPTPIPEYQYIIFGFDLFLLIFTTATLIGKKAEKMDEKIKLINQDTILLWFFFSKASFELADFIVSDPTFLIYKTIGPIIVFLPMLVIAGIYGILSYEKKKTKRKRVRSKKRSKVK